MEVCHIYSRKYGQTLGFRYPLPYLERPKLFIATSTDSLEIVTRRPNRLQLWRFCNQISPSDFYKHVVQFFRFDRAHKSKDFYFYLSTISSSPFGLQVVLLVSLFRLNILMNSQSCMRIPVRE